MKSYTRDTLRAVPANLLTHQVSFFFSKMTRDPVKYEQRIPVLLQRASTVKPQPTCP